MRTVLHNIAALPERLGMRLRQSQPGSVLILVVALLVLMAVIGTAYLSLSTSERVASVQHTYNTQVNILADGVKQMLISVIVDGVMGQVTSSVPAWNSGTTYSAGQVASAGGANYESVVANNTGNNPATDSGANWAMRFYRPQSDSVTTYSYKHYDSPIDSMFLGVREPTLDSGFNSTSGVPVWPYISAPIISSSSFSLSGQFDSPYNPGALAGQPAALPYNQRMNVYPTYVRIPDPNSNDGGTLEYPALTAGGATYLAADASGSGIADAGLVRLPVGHGSSGITWYAGWRVVDNCGAINVNTAWSVNNDFAFAANNAMPAPLHSSWCFRSNIGLSELLQTSNSSAANPYYSGASANPLQEMWNLMAYRTNQQSQVPPLTYTTSNWPDANGQPINEFGGWPPQGCRYDFAYTTQGQALDDNIARRMSNPGEMMYTSGSNQAYSATVPYGAGSIVSSGGNWYQSLTNNNLGMTPPGATWQQLNVAPTANSYQTYSITDGAALAAHGGVVRDSSSQDNIEAALPWSAYYGAPTAPYTPDQVGGSGSTTSRNWYNENYDFSNTFAAPAWNATTAYSAGQRVSVGGVNYQAVSNSVGQSPASDIAASSAPGTGIYWTTLAGMHLRTLLTSYSATSNEIPQKSMYALSNLNPQITYAIVSGTQYPTYPNVNGMWPYNYTEGTTATAAPCKVWINESPVGTLGASTTFDTTFNDFYRNFWLVMSDTPTNTIYQGAGDGDLNPYDWTAAHGSNNGNRQFKSPIRDMRMPAGANTVVMDGFNTMLLRAALASVNAMQLRSCGGSGAGYAAGSVVNGNPVGSVISKTIALKANVNGTLSDVEAMVYSNACNPYIVEVYADNDVTTTSPNGNNWKGYVAVKLYNPYPFPLTLTNWQLGILDRRPPTDTYQPVGAANSYPGTGLLGDRMQFRAITSFTGFGHNNSSVTPNLTYTAPTIPANGWLVLENYNPTDVTPFPTPKTWDARHRSIAASSAGVPQTGVPTALNTVFYYIANLSDVLEDPNFTLPSAATGAILPHSGGELVLLRPRRGDGTEGSNSANADTNDVYNESTNTNSTTDATRAAVLYNLVPVDSFDFTGLSVPANPTPEGPSAPNTAPPYTPTAIHYVRPNPAYPWNAGTNYTIGQLVSYGANTYQAFAASTGVIPLNHPGSWISIGAAPYWKFVYPGRYTVSASQAIATAPYNRQEGTQVLPLVGNPLNTTFTVPVNLGGDNSNINAATLKTGGPGIYYNPFLPIQIDAVGFQGVNAFTQAAANQFPYGQFARNGDMLQIPFIGGYRLRLLSPVAGLATTTTFPYQMLEMNTVTTDSSYAEDGDTSDDDPGVNPTNAESIGRFCPLNGYPASNPGPNTYYSFANRLFDYFDVHNPGYDFTPNVDTHMYTLWPSNQTAGESYSIANVNPSVRNGGVEDNVPIYGLININTAPWPVLSMLPMAVDNTGKVLNNPAPYTSGLGANQLLAQAIVNYRNNPANGPFKSIFDLNKVFDPAGSGNGFQNGWGTITFDNTSANDPGAPQGDVSSLVIGANDGVREDFREQYLVLNRISNLITTRSDSFTCYLIVQGWANAGTPSPQLVVQRRLAFIVDRSSVVPFGLPTQGPPPEMSAGAVNVNRRVRTYNVPTQ